MAATCPACGRRRYSGDDLRRWHDMPREAKALGTTAPEAAWCAEICWTHPQFVCHYKPAAEPEKAPA